jgi:hypothetical protein
VYKMLGILDWMTCWPAQEIVATTDRQPLASTVMVAPNCSTQVFDFPQGNPLGLAGCVDTVISRQGFTTSMYQVTWGS